MMEDIRLGFWEAVPWRWTAVDVRHCNFQTAAKVADPPLYRHMPGEQPRPAAAGSCAGRQMPTCPGLACDGPVAFTAPAVAGR